MTLEKQLEEIDVIQSMFPLEGEVEMDGDARQRLEDAIELDSETKDIEIHQVKPVLCVTMYRGYPEDTTLGVYLQCTEANRSAVHDWNAKLKHLAQSLLGQVSVLETYQLAHDLLSDYQQKEAEKEAQDEQLEKELLENFHAQLSIQQPRVLGRRSIYFHHIIATNKRKIVKYLAHQLDLGGYSKIGWPGIVIVEGVESNVQEYVRQLQHLRWKQMVVRGEQTEAASSDSSAEDLRKLPRSFHEFGENQMSELATACRDHDLEDLFLATMKIYS